MRDLFIDLSEKLVTVFVAVLVLVVLFGGLAAMFAPAPQGGFLKGLLVLVMGGLYAVMAGGMLYLFFGIYRNTQRTNQLLEELLRK